MSKKSDEFRAFSSLSSSVIDCFKPFPFATMTKIMLESILNWKKSNIFAFLKSDLSISDVRCGTFLAISSCSADLFDYKASLLASGILYKLSVLLSSPVVHNKLNCPVCCFSSFVC